MVYRWRDIQSPISVVNQLNVEQLLWSVQCHHHVIKSNGHYLCIESNIYICWTCKYISDMCSPYTPLASIWSIAIVWRLIKIINQNCSVLYRVPQSYVVINTHIWTLIRSVPGSACILFIVAWFSYQGHFVCSCVAFAVFCLSSLGCFAFGSQYSAIDCLKDPSLKLLILQCLTRNASLWFLPCDAMRSTVSVIVILSVRLPVRPSVRLSHSCTVSTWFDLRSWFLHRMVAPSF